MSGGGASKNVRPVTDVPISVEPLVRRMSIAGAPALAGVLRVKFALCVNPLGARSWIFRVPGPRPHGRNTLSFRQTPPRAGRAMRRVRTMASTAAFKRMGGTRRSPRQDRLQRLTLLDHEAEEGGDAWRFRQGGDATGAAGFWPAHGWLRAHARDPARGTGGLGFGSPLSYENASFTRWREWPTALPITSAVSIGALRLDRRRAAHGCSAPSLRVGRGGPTAVR